MPKLAVRFQNEVLGEFSLHSHFNTIGRLPGNDVTIENLGVSRHHAFILGDRAEKIFILEDLGSLNGTYVNKKRIQKHLLHPNDVITIGQHTMEFLLEDIQKPVDPSELTGREPHLLNEKTGEKHYLARDVLYFGNSSVDDIHIPGLMVGKQFASMNRKGENWTINLLVHRFARITLNGEEIQSGLLSPGDRLEVGGIAFLYQVPESIQALQGQQD